MHVYRYRAELPSDSDELLKRLPAGEFVEFHAVEDLRFIDAQFVEIHLRSLSLDELRDLMRDVPDGHVMVQTVQPSELFTGEREHRA
jgi:hypothetical protein